MKRLLTILLLMLAVNARGATIFPITSLSDYIGSFPTNYNQSISNLNAAIGGASLVELSNGVINVGGAATNAQVVASNAASSAVIIGLNATNAQVVASNAAASVVIVGMNATNAQVVASNANVFALNAATNFVPSNAPPGLYQIDAHQWGVGTNDAVGGGGGGANAFANYGGNILLTNNVTTNLNTVTGIFSTDATNGLQVGRLSNGVFLGWGHYAINGDEIMMGGTSNRIVGNNNQATNAAILSGRYNAITDAYDSVISGGKNNSINANTGGSFIGGGNNNSIRAPSCVIVGGGGTAAEQNRIESGSSQSTIGGGWYNAIEANVTESTIAGGSGNTIAGRRSVIAGGYGNDVGTSAEYGAIVGGLFNDIGNSATYGFIGGGTEHDIAANCTYGTISGGRNCDIAGGHHGTIGGGYNNVIASGARYESTIGGGYWNVIGGDGGNQCDGQTIAGGTQNSIHRSGSSFIGGGEGNVVTNHSLHGFIGGGYQNRITQESPASFIGGGWSHMVTNAAYAVIPGGISNKVSATNGFAAGRNAHAAHENAFVFSDGSLSSFASTAQKQFLIQASGGVCINTNAPLAVNGTNAALTVVGATYLLGDLQVDSNSVYIGRTHLGETELKQLYTARKLTNIFVTLGGLLVVNFLRDRWRERQSKRRDKEQSARIEEQTQRIAELERLINKEN